MRELLLREQLISKFETKNINIELYIRVTLMNKVTFQVTERRYIFSHFF